MLRIGFFIFLLVAALAAIYVFWVSLFIAIVITSLPLFVILLVNAERINLFSSGSLGLWVSAKGNALALTGALLLPGRVTEFLKPLYFKSKKSMPIADGLAVVIVERVFDVIGVAVLFFAAIALLPLSETAYLNAARWFIVAILFCLIVMFWLVLFKKKFAEKVLHWVPVDKVKQWLLAHLEKLRQGLMAGLHPWQVLLTAVVWAGSWLCYWLFLQLDGGPELALNASLVVFLVGTLGLTVTVTPGGIGTFEAAVGFILMQYGYTLEQAALSALGLRISALIPNLVVAAYTVFVEGFDMLRINREKLDIKDA